MLYLTTCCQTVGKQLKCIIKPFSKLSTCGLKPKVNKKASKLDLQNINTCDTMMSTCCIQVSNKCDLIEKGVGMVDFVTNRQVLLGEGAILEIPNVLRWYGKNNVLLAAYSADAPAVKTVCEALEKAGAKVVVYDKIVKEPDLAVIDEGTDICISSKCDSVVAIGGGSVLDAAKTISMMAVNGGRTVDYQLGGKSIEKPPLLFVAVPTTAGTGAEATKVSVVYNPEKGFKKALYHTSMIAEVAVLDPNVTISLPPRVTAATGMDALTHAIESYTSVFAHDISRMYSLRAVELISHSLLKAYKNPDDIQARTDMLLGSYFAGCAITVGTCLAHIVGQPVGAILNIPHGDSCSIFLVPSIRLNMDAATSQYADIAKALGVKPGDKNERQLAESGVHALEKLCTDLECPSKLTDYVSVDKIDVNYILDNIQTSMSHIKTNPRPVSRELFEELLRAVL